MTSSAKTSWMDSFGNLPKEYNKKVHGPYCPWRNYGPRDTPFSEVKLGELKDWIMRRNKKPYAAIAAISRTVTHWQMRWVGTRYGPLSKPYLQFIYIGSIISMMGMRPLLKQHRSHKYHW